MEVSDEAFAVKLGRTASSADLGGSSKYSNGTLKTEVGKGSMSTAVGHGLVDPKRWGSSVSTRLIFQASHRKGIRLKFRNLDMDSSRQRN